MTRQTIIADTETTGLDPDRHEIWEIGALLRDGGGEHLWRMKPDLKAADPQALAVGRYYKRTAGMLSSSFPATWDLADPAQQDQTPYWSDPRLIASKVAPLLDDATIVAANPTFDAGFLTAFLRYHGEAPAWHYRLRDIGSMAWAWLQAHHLPHHLPTPAIDASTDDLARAMGIEPEDFERHSALGDCRLVAAMLDVIERGPVQ